MQSFAGYTLFLDRDGVLNRRIVDDYVLKLEQFVIIDGVLDALKVFSNIFDHIVVVTNQQGIGKGLMTEDDLHVIHAEFLNKVSEHCGRIDKIYFCPNLASEHSFNRKPNIGMALQAKRDFAHIKFNRSVMIGDSLSDMKFGKHAGMTTVLVGNDYDVPRKYPHLVDYCYSTLHEFAKAIVNL